MNNIISIYELLGLIKNGKAPKFVRYDNCVWQFKEQFDDYFNNVEYLIGDGFDNWDNAKKYLEEKVEIIENKPIIEKLDVALLSQCDNWLWCPSKDEISKDIELNSYIIQNISENTLYFQRKINEIIDYLNRKEKDND